MNLLEVHNLKVSYGGIHALKGIDIEIAQGELVALIGSNGAGKTTTLKALEACCPARARCIMIIIHCTIALPISVCTTALHWCLKAAVSLRA